MVIFISTKYDTMLTIIKNDESEWGIEMNDLMQQSGGKFNYIITFESYNN